MSPDTASSASQSQLLTHTRPYVQHGHEAVIAQTTVTPWHIGALAAITDVRVLFTLIHICTRPPIWHQRVAVSTAAPVAALSVNAVPITPSTPSKAFVDVHAALVVGGAPEASVAGALEGANDIDALAMRTQAVTQGALVDILTGSALGR